MAEPANGEVGFFITYIKMLSGYFPTTYFLKIRTMTDFGPLIANPRSILLGAAAQFGIFFAFLGH